jgi:hypothetical protein
MIKPVSPTRGSKTSTRSPNGGPLPWLPGISDRITADPNWGPYLEARSRLVRDLADHVRANAGGEVPAWAAKRYAPVSTELVADVQVWRAATQVDAGDLRPTGPPQLGRAAHVWQQRLDERLAAADMQPGAPVTAVCPRLISVRHHEAVRYLLVLSRAGWDSLWWRVESLPGLAA